MLFAYIFFSKDPVCDQNDIVAGSDDEPGKEQIEVAKYELKELIFQAGFKKSDIPLMGDKTLIFEEKKYPKYNFKIASDTLNGEECYVFRITPKTAYKKNAVYKELTTWFRKSDYAIIARYYALSYFTHLYDFDVHLKVITKQIGTKLYPTDIIYSGNCHIATIKREQVTMNIQFEY